MANLGVTPCSHSALIFKALSPLDVPQKSSVPEEDAGMLLKLQLVCLPIISAFMHMPPGVPADVLGKTPQRPCQPFLHLFFPMHLSSNIHISVQNGQAPCLGNN